MKTTMTQYLIKWTMASTLTLYYRHLTPNYYEKNDMLQNIFIRTKSLVVSAKSHDLLT